MKKLIEELKEAIELYEKCEDVCAAEHIMADAMCNFNRCLRKVQEELNEQMLAMMQEF